MKSANIIIEGIVIALNSLRAHKLRTFLTILGISTGIFAITSIFTFVHSLQSSISQNLSKLGNRVIYVHKFPWNPGSGDWRKYQSRPHVSYRDYEKLERELTGEDAMCFEASINGMTLRHQGRSTEGVQVKAITRDYAKINALNIESGRYFSESELNSGRGTCLLGATVARELFGSSDPLGKYIRFLGKKIKVIGILEREGAGMFGESRDDMAFINYKWAGRKFNMSSRSINKLITVRAAQYDQVEFVESEIIGLIRAARGLSPYEEDTFSINKQEMLMNSLDDFFGYLRIGGFVISIFSVLVGGFAIFNIMFSSVKERTFEIGLQKSLGATRAFVLFQFLFESVLQCLIGGAMGMVVLWLLTIAGEMALENMEIQMSLEITFWNIVMGLGISIIIGLLSGFAPALMASRLDPVESMRRA